MQGIKMSAENVYGLVLILAVFAGVFLGLCRCCGILLAIKIFLCAIITSGTLLFAVFLLYQ
jgi:hypothetical protein